MQQINRLKIKSFRGCFGQKEKTCKRAELHSYKAKTKFTEREKHPIYKEKRSNTFVSNLYFSNGTPLGTRTLDPLIKSQLLYQLS